MRCPIKEWWLPYIAGYETKLYKSKLYIEVDWSYKSVYFPFYWKSKKVIILS